MVLGGLLWGCASIGNPSGGARDEDPPRFVAARPAPGSVNVDPANIDISIEFNELINVKNAFENVVLSPPGKSVPRVSTRGRRVLITGTDTLLPNTTYTIDFGDAIEDNNEGNALSGFAYTFSTGPVLDSLRISGMVLGAEDMEPQQGVFVGAYTSLEDSAFIKKPFERVARTDEMGRFVIRGLQDTTYRLFALKDLDNDKHYANPEEDIAWYEGLIRPTSERIMTHDTIRDLYTGVVDTVVERERTRFLPNNILLRMYNTGIKPQYLLSYSRPDSTKLSFIFNAPSEKQPTIRLANDSVYPDPLIAETTEGNDTLTFFLPLDIARRDTLDLAVEYINTNVNTGLPKVINDTVKLIKPKVNKPKEKKKKKKKKKVAAKDQESEYATEELRLPTDSIAGLPGDSLSIATPTHPKEDDNEEDDTPKPATFRFQTTGPEKNIEMPISLEVQIPLASLDSTAFRLEVQEDSVWEKVPLPYKLQRADTLSQRRFKIEYPWQRGVSYRLTADSLAGTDIYGIQSEKLNFEFKTKPEDEVSNLKLTLTGLENDIPAFVELMTSGDKPSYMAKVENGVANFRGIDGGKYYARVYEDFNGDGKFTTGSYRLQRVYGKPDSTAFLHDTTLPNNDSTGIPTDTMIIDEDIIISNDSTDMPSDSLNIIQSDSTAMNRPATERKPMTDKEVVERLKKIGYSLEPLDTDTVGTDILIAIQPDLVYYYPKIINVKKAWDIDQSWNVFETALDLQKPSKIRKNKPKRKGNRQEEQPEDEEDDEYDLFTNPFNPNDRNNKLRNNRNR